VKITETMAPALWACKPWQEDWSNRHQRWAKTSARPKTGHRQLRQQPLHADGFTMLEVLLSICIITASLALLASLLTNQANNPRKASALNAIETTASADLTWIRNYAKLWRLESGPYSTTTNTITGADSFTQSSYLSYQPDPDSCAAETLPSDFLVAAQAVVITPAKLATIADSTPVSGAEKQITLPTEAGSTQLWRSITFTDQTDHIVVSYYLKNDGLNLDFKRNTAILIESAAWCP
jgi:Tfp pilus assembly protein PilV